jgi:hypothetical protein
MVHDLGESENSDDETDSYGDDEVEIQMSDRTDGEVEETQSDQQ